MHKGESPVCYSSLGVEDSTNIITFGIDYISTFEIDQHYYTDIDSQEGGDFDKDVLLFGDKAGC